MILFLLRIFLTGNVLLFVISGAAFAAPSAQLNILFLGNSYIYTNNLPGMLKKIAISDAGNPKRFIVDSYTMGGATLKNLWEKKEARNLLGARHWDYVVLQEQSLWAMYPDRIKETFSSVYNWNQEILKFSGKPLLFATWARQSDSAWYTNTEYAFLQSSNYMQYMLDYYTNNLGKSLNIGVIQVGDYWAYAQSEYPDLSLYALDGSHPSPAGSYLTALVFYRFFAQRSLDSVTYAPPSLSPAQATLLRKIASAQNKG